MTILEKFNFYISYSQRDSKDFRIAEIALKLEQQQNIDQVFYYERDLAIGENLVEYIEKTISYSDAIIVICSKNTTKSEFLMKEYQYGLYLDKPIVPVFRDTRDIPAILASRLGVQYDSSNFEEFISKLINILDKIRSVSSPDILEILLLPNSNLLRLIKF